MNATPPRAENPTSTTDPDTTGDAQPATGTELVDVAYAWDTLNRDQARELWSELTKWTDWLRATYHIETRIKACWYRHRPVVEELTALMVAHKAVYLTTEDARAAYTENLTAWHTQWYRTSLDAIARLQADCTRDHCAWTDPEPINAADPSRQQYIGDDVTRRPNP